MSWNQIRLFNNVNWIHCMKVIFFSSKFNIIGFGKNVTLDTDLAAVGDIADFS